MRITFQTCSLDWKSPPLQRWVFPIQIFYQYKNKTIHTWVYTNTGKAITFRQNRRLVAASLTGISPRPMLMGAPHDALRASNAGVSLSVATVMADRVPLCFSDVSLSLVPARRSWRKRPCGSRWHERTCLLYSVPQLQPFSMYNIGSLSACISHQAFDG